MPEDSKCSPTGGTMQVVYCFEPSKKWLLMQAAKEISATTIEISQTDIICPLVYRD
jgi:hypothetical protein